MVLWDILNDFSVLAVYKKDDDCKTVQISGNQVICGYRSGCVTAWPVAAKRAKTCSTSGI